MFLLLKCCLTACSSAAFNVHGFYVHDPGTQIRVALTGTIYKKIFNLSLETIGETTIGRIINLASSDVQRIEFVSKIHDCPYVFSSSS